MRICRKQNERHRQVVKKLKGFFQVGEGWVVFFKKMSLSYAQQDRTTIQILCPRFCNPTVQTRSNLSCRSRLKD